LRLLCRVTSRTTIVYTDASFHWYEEPGKERVPVAVLGFYVIDRITKAELYSSFMLPTYYCG